MDEAAAMNDPRDMQSARQQAEYWFARLRADDCSGAERRDFEAWLAADAGHAAAYAQIERLWLDLEGLAEDADIQRARRAARHSARTAARGAGRRRLLIAASLVAALAAGWLAFLLWPSTSVQRYATTHGEQRSVVLADGSRLILNTDTTLEVRLLHHIRSARLVRGEAMFEIVHDPQRPFIVRAGGDTIVDLGTRFDVRNGGDRATVSVLQGEVNVERGSHALQLGAGQQLIAGRGIWQHGPVDPETVAAWTQGRMVFRDTPLGVAVAEANRYGPTRLVIADPRLDDLRISGDFRIGATQALVHALESAFPVRAQRDANGDTIRLYRRPGSSDPSSGRPQTS